MNALHRKQALISENQVLLLKLRSVQARINDLEQNHDAEGDLLYDSGLSNPDSHMTGTAFGDQEEESLESLRKCVHASEEILGISVLHYARGEVAPCEGLPAGRWYETNMNLIILGTLKVALNIVEGIKDGKSIIFSINAACSESPPTRAELSTLLQNYCQIGEENGTGTEQRLGQGLYLSLRRYAEKSAARKTVLKEFKRQYGGQCVIETSEEGILVQWPRLFQMSWAVTWDEDTERIVDSINLELMPQAGVKFIMSCESSLRRLTEPTSSSAERLSCLQEVAARAVSSR